MIPAYSTLVFDVEVLGIEEPEEVKEAEETKTVQEVKPAPAPKKKRKK